MLGLALVLAFAYLARAAIRVTSDADADVTIECAPTTGVDPDACLAWGDAIAGEGQPSFTFEMDDLARLRIDRPMVGFSATCEVAYFTSRYPDDAVWMEEIPCITAR